MVLYDRSGKPNVGHALETAVLHELHRRGYEANYVRTEHGFEVDFFVRKQEGEEMLVQVSAHLDDPDTLAREIRALLDAKAQSPKAAAMLITLNRPAMMGVPDDIELVTAAEWLLA